MTVSEAVDGTRRRRSGKRREPVKTRSVKVDRRVWSKAMELAGSDPRRIIVVTDTEVVVANYRVR